MSGGIVQRTVNRDEIRFLQNGIELFEFSPLRSFLKIGIEGYHLNAEGRDFSCHFQSDLYTSDKAKRLSTGSMDGDPRVKIPLAGFHLSVKEGSFSD